MAKTHTVTEAAQLLDVWPEDVRRFCERNLMFANKLAYPCSDGYALDIPHDSVLYMRMHNASKLKRAQRRYSRDLIARCQLQLDI